MTLEDAIVRFYPREVALRVWRHLYDRIPGLTDESYISDVAGQFLRQHLVDDWEPGDDIGSFLIDNLIDHAASTLSWEHVADRILGPTRDEAFRLYATVNAVTA